MFRQAVLALALAAASLLVAGCVDTDNYRTPDPDTGPQENVGLEPGADSDAAGSDLDETDQTGATDTEGEGTISPPTGG